MKINFSLLVSMLVFVLLLSSVSAWDPRDNITLRDRYSILNGVTANFTLYYGNGSQLTGVTTSIANYSSFANSSTYWADVSDWVSGWFIQTGSNLDFNETKLNATIDARENDTTYTAGSNLTLTGTEFSLNTVGVRTWLNNVYALIGDVFSGAYGDLTGKPILLSNFTDDLGDRGYTSLNNFTNDPGYITSYTETDPIWIAAQSSYSTTAEILAFGYYNASDFIITDYFTKSDVLAFDYYNSSDFSISDYFTKVEVLAFDYYNSTDFVISDYFTSTQVLGFNYYNSTDFVISDYYTKAQIESFGYYNLSDFNIANYYTSAQTDTEISNANNSMKNYVDGSFITQANEGNLNVNGSNYWDGLNTFNATQMQNNGGTLSIILSWFSSQFDLLFSAKDTDDLTEGSSNLYDNQSWNESHANALYADISIDGTVTSVVAGNGMDFTTITGSGSVTMGLPGSLTAVTSNAVTATSHTHAVSGFLESLIGDTTPQLGGYLDANGENIGSTTDEIENIYVGDTTRIYFGDGQDASIYFNGTNLIISG